MANPPIVGKTLTQVGTPLIRVAKQLAADAQRVGTPSKYRIINGFILRGVKMHNRYVGQVIDTPALVVLAGTGQGVLNELIGVGNRDDFVDTGALPGTLATYTAAGSIGGDRTIAPVPPIPPALVINPAPPATLYTEAQPQLQEHLWSPGLRILPLSNLGQFDDLDNFGVLTYSTQIRVGSCVTVPAQTSATYGFPIQLYRGNYMSSNSFWIMESDLPAGWSMLPRRLVAASTYAAADPYKVELLTRALLFGVATVPAADSTGTDQYCMAFAGIKQYRSIWTGPPGDITQYDYYDRQGMGALVVARGSLPRSDFDPESPVVLRGDSDSVTLVLTTAIPETQIHPTPATYTGVAGGPTLDTPSYFLAPAVARYTGGFAKFCVYWAPYTVSGGGDQMSYAILALNDANTVSVLKADRSATYPTVPPITGADGAKLVVPWIVGAVSVERIVAEVPQRTAYCLVWEQWTSRNAPSHAAGSTSTTQWPNSYELGGRWALYATQSGTFTRTEIAYTCAPLFSPNMYERSVFPTLLSYTPAGGGRNWWYAPDTSFSSVYQMGPELLVTACIPAGYFKTWVDLDPTFGTFKSGFAHVDVHNVSCAVLDLATNTFTVRGVIAERLWADQYCHITVVQPEVPAVGATPAIPAVMLATMRLAIDNGLVSGQPPDKTYLTVDGGYTWREYIEDAAGGNGTFLIGNPLWALDPSGRFDTNPFGN